MSGSSFNPDGFGPLFEQICSDLTPVRDVLLTVGAIYSAKVIATNLWDVLRAVRVFLLPKLLPWETDLPKSYGKWAGEQ